VGEGTGGGGAVGGGYGRVGKGSNVARWEGREWVQGVVGGRRGDEGGGKETALGVGGRMGVGVERRGLGGKGNGREEGGGGCAEGEKGEVGRWRGGGRSGTNGVWEW